MDVLHEPMFQQTAFRDFGELLLHVVRQPFTFRCQLCQEIGVVSVNNLIEKCGLGPNQICSHSGMLSALPVMPGHPEIDIQRLWRPFSLLLRLSMRLEKVEQSSL